MSAITKTPPTIQKWLALKISATRSELRSREEMEVQWRTGTDAEWAETARLHPRSAKQGPVPREDRLRLAEIQRRIAANCRMDLKMFESLLAVVVSREGLR